VLWYGGRAVLDGRLSIGTLVSFNFWVVMLAGPAQNLGFLVNRAGEAVASGRRLFEILDMASDVQDVPGAIELPAIRGHVAFEHVSFAYGTLADAVPASVKAPGAAVPPGAAQPGMARAVLHDISFAAEPNQVVALFGPTGSGKSSIVNLIPRFYDPTAGAIRIDGHDLRDVTVDSLRRQIALVLQDTFRFSSTIRDNIAYGRLDADDAAVADAARAARAHEFILRLPEGYDTIIGERGVTLSGGQRQRLAIARAILKDAPIVLLDEPTTGLDSESERLVMAAMRELLAGRTALVIAHRLSTIRHADIILVLEDGEIVERGDHGTLLASKGRYQALDAVQLGAEPVDGPAAAGAGGRRR
jgi:ABC-type multidrug transport system fused ATPase/permease subunit